MKKILFIFAIAVFLASCSASNTSDTKKAVTINDRAACRIIINQM